MTVKLLFTESSAVHSVHDHVSPRAWKGNVYVRNVDLRKCWDLGFHRAEEHLDEASFPSALHMMRGNEGYDMLCLFGKNKMVLVEALTAEERDETKEEGADTPSSAVDVPANIDVNIPLNKLTPHFDDIVNLEEAAIDSEVLVPSPNTLSASNPDNGSIAALTPILPLGGAPPNPWITLSEERGPRTRRKK